MGHSKVFKAIERRAYFLDDKEKKGKKKVQKARRAPKPITPKTLAYEARTAHNKRRQHLHHVMNRTADRDGLPLESGDQLLRYMSNKSFKGKPKLKDLDEPARAYLAKLLEKDMGAGYKRELARLEALERSEEEEKSFQELEMQKVEKGVQELEMEDGEGEVDEEEGEEEENFKGFETVLPLR